ncbi:GntR family transcriptional regulator [Ensifer aridi]|uniref:GntR family transcriptional regulator n=1 Tax=Ensifer aridi TaxID=1708715 RepID=UPI000A0FEB5E|nr:GntR family transcriptional regulator [Ensifer aridi]
MNEVLASILPYGGIDDGGAGPLYHRLRLSLEKAIQSGKLRAGDVLCPERDLAEYANVSRVTVRKAIDLLVRDGLLMRRHGSGTFVVDRSTVGDQRTTKPAPVAEGIFWCSVSSQAEWLERRLSPPSPQEMMTFALAGDEQVARFTRLLISDGRPLAVERTSVPAFLIADPFRITVSIHEVLASAGARPVRAVQRIFARAIQTPDAGLLEASEGAAGLVTERVAFLSTGRAVELTHSTFRDDADGFVSEFAIPQH